MEPISTITTKPLAWKTFEPLSFLCGICRKDTATYQLTYKRGILEINLPVCGKCRLISPQRFEDEVLASKTS